MRLQAYAVQSKLVNMWREWGGRSRFNRHSECDIIHVDESDSMSIGEFDFLLSDGPSGGNNVGNNPENLKFRMTGINLFSKMAFEKSVQT